MGRTWSWRSIAATAVLGALSASSAGGGEVAASRPDRAATTRITGIISGVDGARAKDVNVALYAGGSAIMNSYTAADGVYSFVISPGTNFQLGFFPQGNSPYIYEYYNNVREWTQAARFSAAAGQTRTINATLDRGGQASGRVTNNAGAPLSGILVRAQNVVNGGYGEATSNSTGAYTIVGLQPGQYRIRFAVGSAYFFEEYYNNVSSAGFAVKLGFVANQVRTGINAVLTAKRPFAPPAPAGTALVKSVRLTWTPRAANGYPVSDYIVQFRATSTSAWTTFADGVRSTTGATVTGLTPRLGYRFRVAAKSAGGQSAWGPESATVVPLPGLPGAPTGLTVAPSSTIAQLRWSAPADTGGAPVTDYVVQLSANGGSTWSTFADPVTASAAANVTGLTLGTTYRFRVAARTIAGTGPFGPMSAPVTTLRIPLPPYTPTGVAGVKSATLSWAAPFNGGLPITDYVIQVSANGAAWTMVNDGISTPTTALITNLTTGVSYRFKVAARNSLGTSASSPASNAVVVR